MALSRLDTIERYRQLRFSDAYIDTTRTSPYTTPPVSAAFTRLGLKAYTATDNKKETAAPMAIRAATNIQILAGAIHAVETNVADLARDLKNLKIEVQLAPGTAPKEPSPPSSTQEEDNDDVLSRLDELETRTDNLRDYNVETSAALAAIKHTAPPMVVAEQLSSGLHASLIGRFDAITRDRDILDSNTQYLATKHAKADARQSTAIDELRAENADLRAKLCAIEATVAQLSFAPPVPIRSHSRSRSREPHATPARSRSPISRTQQAPVRKGETRSRSPYAPQAPAHMRETRRRSLSTEATRDPKRSRQSDSLPPVINMGPFPTSTLSALDLFESHIQAAIPNHFHHTSARTYQIERDSVMAHNLRISMQTQGQATALMSAWSSNRVPGYSNIQMHMGSNDSASQARTQYQSQRGGRQGPSGSSHKLYSSTNRY
ncbi:hypothetical protein C8J57DRAFT_1588145 [Mycena rebaudengoi]|nr:hypothetical protein C8J57DRAFT_1588145 [Mycena rebaudengoi]